MTDIAVRRAARAAARRLAGELDPDLRTQVETALEASDEGASPQQYTDPVALGSLIVSAAGLAWTIYRDLRAKAPKPAPRVIVKQVEIELPADDTIPSAQRARAIEVVVEEILKDLVLSDLRRMIRLFVRSMCCGGHDDSAGCLG